MGFFGRTSKRLGHVRFAVLAMAVAIAPACHYFDDDDSGSSVGPSVFAGAWTGTLRLTDGSTHDLQWQFDVNSMIIGETVDSVPTGFTGSVEFAAGDHESPTVRFYEFELSDGATTRTGGFYVEDRIRYGIVVYDNGDFAALEKSERSRPIFRETDLTDQKTLVVFGTYVRWIVPSVIDEVGRWTIETGKEVLSPAGIPYDGELDRVPYSGDFTNFSDQGVWEGLEDPSDPYPMITLMSFDKKFAGTYECNPGFPECVFTIWPFRNPRPL